MGRKMIHGLRENIINIMEFYKELGFESLPLQIKTEQSSTVNSEKIHEKKDICFSDSKTQEIAADKDRELTDLRNEIGDCQRCKLSKGRSNIVFGEGNPNARIMFIGEGPGREEDIQARPFVGDAGQLLTRMIEKMGLKREDVYIANIVKCRPPMNRDPQDDEMDSCFPFLNRQIEIVAPEVIVCLGKISAYKILGIKEPISKFSISKVRGRFYEYKGIPVMPTFHPAYLLRNKKDKWLTWHDMQAVLSRLKIDKGGST